MTLHLPDWFVPVTGVAAWLAPSPLSLLKQLVTNRRPFMADPNITPDVTAFANALVSAVVSTHDAEARKGAVIAAVDTYKDKLAADLGANPLEVAALNWVASDAEESKLYDTFDQAAEALVHEVAASFVQKVIPTLKAALHLG